MDGGASLYLAIAALGAVAYTDYQSGKAVQYEHKAAAEEAKMAARDDEIKRRQRLIQALASRNVASGASGASLEGSDIALINRDFREYSIDSLTGEAMTAARVKSLKVAGANAKKIGTMRAVGSLLQAGSLASGSFARPATTTTASSSSGNLGRISGGGAS